MSYFQIPIFLIGWSSPKAVVISNQWEKFEFKNTTNSLNVSFIYSVVNNSQYRLLRTNGLVIVINR